MTESNWLELEEAAERVGRSVATLYRWKREKNLRILLGRVKLSELLAADALATSRRGRPRKTDSATPPAE